MTIKTIIWCDNCPAVLVIRRFSADPPYVVLRADSIQPGWTFDSDGSGHLCPDCDDYDEEAQR